MKRLALLATLLPTTLMAHPGHDAPPVHWLAADHLTALGTLVAFGLVVLFVQRGRS